MASAGIFGAAVCTGFALFIAVTIVVYRYYNQRRKTKEWDTLEQRSGDKRVICSMIIDGIQREFNVTKEHHAVQPPQNSSAGQAITAELMKIPLELCSNTGTYTNNVGITASSSQQQQQQQQHCPLQHQSKSYPCGRQLCRTPSVSSQSSLDSCGGGVGGGGGVSKQTQRGGSSPQIRAYAPDGGATKTPILHHHTYQPPPHPLSPYHHPRSPSPHHHQHHSSHHHHHHHHHHSHHSRANSIVEIIRSNSPIQTNDNDNVSTRLINNTNNNQCTNNTTTITTNTNIGGSTVPGNNVTSRCCLSPLFIPRFPATAMLGSVGGGVGGVIEGGGGGGVAQQPPASPLGAIQPDLYMRKDGPLFIAASRGTHSLGRLHFRLKYDFDRSDLIVHLIEAHDLAGSDQGGFNDPYVKLTLIPEVDSRKRQTATIMRRNEVNPFFDQEFKFPISHEDLQTKTLILQVVDYDRFSRNDVIGEVEMRMDEFDITTGIEVWGDITKNRKPPGEQQEVLVSLSYLPSAERLTVVILKAKNLSDPLEKKENIDPFVKVYLVVNGKRVKKKKTAARKACTNPVWNEALTFSLSSSNVQNAAVEICILDQANDLIGTNPLIGCCFVGPKEEGPERDHWLDMVQSPRKAVACWHIMR